MLNARNVAIGLAVSFLVLSFAAMPGVDAGPAQAAGDLIYVPVTVMDNKNQPVATLKEADFQLLEDNKEQKLTYFSGAGEPIAVDVILALSARGPVKSPGQRDRITVDILNAVDRVREANGAVKAQLEQIPLDSDATFNVVSSLMDKVSRLGTPRKALIVVGDGLTSTGMGTSAPLPKAVIEASKVSSFPIYFLGVHEGTQAPSWQEGTNSSTGYYLEQIADFSGGRVITGQIDNDLVLAATNLRDSLKNQYVLGYRSPNVAKDGKWRKLTIKMSATAGKVKLTHKERYFVPKG